MVIVGLILFIESRISGAQERPGKHLSLFPARWQRNSNVAGYYAGGIYGY